MLPPHVSASMRSTCLPRGGQGLPGSPRGSSGRGGAGRAPHGHHPPHRTVIPDPTDSGAIDCGVGSSPAPTPMGRNPVGRSTAWTDQIGCWSVHRSVARENAPPAPTGRQPFAGCRANAVTGDSESGEAPGSTMSGTPVAGEPVRRPRHRQRRRRSCAPHDLARDPERVTIHTTEGRRHQARSAAPEAATGQQFRGVGAAADHRMSGATRARATSWASWRWSTAVRRVSVIPVLRRGRPGTGTKVILAARSSTRPLLRRSAQ